jgi:hypothetical protein
LIALLVFLSPGSKVVTNLDDAGDQLGTITVGRKQTPCASDLSGSNVQIFENGWLLIRYSNNQQIIYAILRISDSNQILWKGAPDDSNGRSATCDGVENEQLLQFGFRWRYCNSPDLKTRLGKPITGEIGAWMQYQKWSGGLLAYGLPVEVVRERRIRETKVQEAFTSLVGVFLNNDDSPSDAGWKLGKRVQFTFQNADPKNVYCTALWYPAKAKQPIPDDLKKRNDCDTKVDGWTYAKPHDQCIIFGFE